MQLRHNEDDLTVLHNMRKFNANFRSVLRSSSGKNEGRREERLGKERGGRGGEKSQTEVREESRRGKDERD